jgi:DNA invertase Pin-like site-specific DNA recombinase
MEKVKAYSYLRISSDAQLIGDSMRRQIEAGERYAEKHGYDLVETIKDLGISGFKGKNAREGAFAKFLAAIEQEIVPSGSILIVESLYRLSRDGATKAFSQFAGMLSKGITIVTLLDEQEYTKDSVNSNSGQLFTSIGVMIRANEESTTKSKRLKEVWSQKRTGILNQKLTGKAPAWLKLETGKKEL